MSYAYREIYELTPFLGLSIGLALVIEYDTLKPGKGLMKMRYELL